VNEHELLVHTIASDLLKRMQVDGIVKVQRENEVLLVDISSSEAAVLIGTKGEVLDSLQHLLRSLVQKQIGEFIALRVDIEGYRQRRNAQLVEIAKKTSMRVKNSGKPEALNPMSASDRRIVHMMIKEMDGVISESIGEGKDRKIVVKPIMKKIW
jgi:spoIIIJ-associated protein